MSQISPFVACIELARYASLAGVSFRVLADGTVETDSVEDALKLRAALLRQEARRQSPDSDELPINTQRFLVVVAANPLGVTSEEISKVAGIPTKSVPPLIRGLGYWATRHGVKLNQLLLRKQSFEKGKPISTYALTVEGRRKFQKVLKPATVIENQSSDNTLDFDPFMSRLTIMQLHKRAEKLEDVRWNKPNTSFTATCPLSNGSHRIAMSNARTACLGGCSKDQIEKYFSKHDDE